MYCSKRVFHKAVRLITHRSLFVHIPSEYVGARWVEDNRSSISVLKPGYHWYLPGYHELAVTEADHWITESTVIQPHLGILLKVRIGFEFSIADLPRLVQSCPQVLRKPYTSSQVWDPDYKMLLRPDTWLRVWDPVYDIDFDETIARPIVNRITPQLLSNEGMPSDEVHQLLRLTNDKLQVCGLKLGTIAIEHTTMYGPE